MSTPEHPTADQVVAEARTALQEVVADKTVTPSLQQAAQMQPNQVEVAASNALTKAANLHAAAAACLMGHGQQVMQGLFAAQSHAR